MELSRRSRALILAFGLALLGGCGSTGGTGNGTPATDEPESQESAGTEQHQDLVRKLENLSADASGLAFAVRATGEVTPEQRQTMGKLSDQAQDFADEIDETPGGASEFGHLKPALLSMADSQFKADEVAGLPVPLQGNSVVMFGQHAEDLRAALDAIP